MATNSVNEGKLKFVEAGDAKYSGIVNDYALFIQDKQLKDESLWEKFVSVFNHNADIFDEGWRGEYWGKMMRGACLTYLYTKDDALYNVLEKAVKGLIAEQDDLGRISTYDTKTEFTGWDMWCRKYTLTGLEHFYRIAKDDVLKQNIIDALKKQADYIVSKIGSDAGKKPITKTSDWWGGVNSCSILESFIELYKMTAEKRYLDFAEYIIESGGCDDGDLFKLALENKLMPYEYPTVKAYETMSFFEGLLAYYEVTGKKEYLTATKNFVLSVYKSDITVIGSAGCTHELFDNSIVKQTEFSDVIMQETCVTVTWIRLLSRLHLITGESFYINRIESSAYNALYGSINTSNIKHFSYDINDYVDALPFDSYSPLYMNTRGRGVGGFKQFKSGGYYGCCACIGAAATALFPLVSTLKSDKGIVINNFLNGDVKVLSPTNQKVKLSFVTDYPVGGKFKIKLSLEKPETFEIRVRIPDFCDKSDIDAGGAKTSKTNGYHIIEKEFCDGDEITVNMQLDVKIVSLNGKTAFTYGAIALARDEQKELDNSVDIAEVVAIKKSGDRAAIKEMPALKQNEQLRIVLETADDDKGLLLTDYASCGKNWLEKRAKMSVWLNVK